MAKVAALEDRFRDSCDLSSCYPCNLLETIYPTYALKEWHQRLRTESGRIFDRDEARLEVFELYDGAGFYPNSFTDENKLFAHLHQNRKDPRFRYIPIEAGSSMDPLQCSPEMFTALCSYHQISPTFLDSVFSFGSAEEPRDCGLATFAADDTLLARDQSLLSLPSLGRSGREIRLSYLLRSVERSNSLPTRNWSMRQMAVYHSFDVITGRSTWVTLKGNDLIKKRIEDATGYLPAFRPGKEQDIGEAFSAALEIHLIPLDWCGENWRWYINDLEDEIRRILRKAKTAKIDADPHFSDIPDDIKQAIRAGSFYSKPESRSNTGKKSGKPGAGNVRKFINWTGFGRGKPIVREKTATGKNGVSSSQQQATGLPEHNTKDRLDKLVVLDMFSFDEMRRLQDIAEKIEEALLVVRLNSTVISQISHYYGDLSRSKSVNEMASIQKQCRDGFARFLSRAKSIESGLSIRKQQLESVLRLANDGRTLYDGILQYRSVQISRVYAESAHESTRKMEKIAHKTEVETFSMHIITFVTLIFLPGTFISVGLLLLFYMIQKVSNLTSRDQTFFQSGIFQWNELDTGGATWLFKKDAFTMFAAISVVITVITLIAWFVIFRCLRRRSRQRLLEHQDGLDTLFV